MMFYHRPISKKLSFQTGRPLDTNIQASLRLTRGSTRFCAEFGTFSSVYDRPPISYPRRPKGPSLSAAHRPYNARPKPPSICSPAGNIVPRLSANPTGYLFRDSELRAAGAFFAWMRFLPAVVPPSSNAIQACSQDEKIRMWKGPLWSALLTPDPPPPARLLPRPDRCFPRGLFVALSRAARSTEYRPAPQRYACLIRTQPGLGQQPASIPSVVEVRPLPTQTPLRD